MALDTQANLLKVTKVPYVNRENGANSIMVNLLLKVTSF